MPVIPAPTTNTSTSVAGQPRAVVDLGLGGFHASPSLVRRRWSPGGPTAAHPRRLLRTGQGLRGQEEVTSVAPTLPRRARGRYIVLTGYVCTRHHTSEGGEKRQHGVAITDQNRSALKVPYAMEVADRVRKERYFDPDFYQMEAELLWPRVWQMACRLEEIPEPYDFVEYEIPRPVGHRPSSNRRHGRRGVPECLPASGRPARRGPGELRDRGRLAVPRVVLRSRRHQHLRHQGEDLLRAQSHMILRSHAGAVRDVGWMCVDQPR